MLFSKLKNSKSNVLIRLCYNVPFLMNYIDKHRNHVLINSRNKNFAMYNLHKYIFFIGNQCWFKTMKIHKKILEAVVLPKATSWGQTCLKSIFINWVYFMISQDNFYYRNIHLINKYNISPIFSYFMFQNHTSLSILPDQQIIIQLWLTNYARIYHIYHLHK